MIITGTHIAYLRRKQEGIPTESEPFPITVDMCVNEHDHHSFYNQPHFPLIWKQVAVDNLMKVYRVMEQIKPGSGKRHLNFLAGTYDLMDREMRQEKESYIYAVAHRIMTKIIRERKRRHVPAEN